MTNIVVAMDGSESAMQALGWAQELGRSATAPVLHLVNACPLQLPVSGFKYDVVLEAAENAAREMLAQAAARVQGMPVQTYFRPEDPVDAILRVAAEVQATLVVMGRRGLGRAAALVLGSVSSAVLHNARVPVMVVHTTPARPVQRVLVGVDGSEHSGRALAFAAAWAPTATLTAFHVLNLGPEVGSLLSATDLSLEQLAERSTHEAVQKALVAAGLPEGRVEAQTARGNAADELVTAYATGGYDLAVVGSRGRGLLGELLLGSVSERLTRLSAGPVVVVR